ncbi:MAG TPA: HIT domain-containing protein [Candidatus Korarchaeota archaeon]|nr:HIT domain-containing protein [Candidatus Korarchaeota archaeon]
MERLWAIWRVAYIKIASKQEGCIFCELPSSKKDDENLILLRSEHAFLMLNRFPYNPGHLMIAPYRHLGDIEDLTQEEVLDIWKILRLSIRALKETMSPDGFNIGINVGRVAGAGFEGHVHVHIVPRWNGDTNFMPVVAETKVISESLESVYGELREVIKRIQEENV